MPDKKDPPTTTFNFDSEVASPRTLTHGVAKSLFNSFRNAQKGFVDTKFARLLNRDSAFNQSSGKVNVDFTAKGDTRRELLSLYQNDWFHVILAMKLWITILYMAVFLLASWLLFAVGYYFIDRASDSCHLNYEPEDGEEYEHIPFQSAMAFSVITAGQIGYTFITTGDAYYFNCHIMVTVVYIQLMLALITNAIFVGIVLIKISTARSRAHQIIFSNKAVIKLDQKTGKWVFSFQVFDLEQACPVIEAHIRMYAVNHNNKLEATMMRVQKPTDQLGSALLLAIPYTVTHDVDDLSPLFPTSEESLVLTSICSVCATTFQTHDLLKKHVRYETAREAAEFLDNPELHDKGHSSLKFKEEKESVAILDEASIEAHLKANRFEIVVVVEGIEARTSSSFQARNSYTIGDIEVNKEIVSCVQNTSKGVVVDLSAFHQTAIVVPAPSSSS